MVHKNDFRTFDFVSLRRPRLKTCSAAPQHENVADDKKERNEVEVEVEVEVDDPL